MSRFNKMIHSIFAAWLASSAPVFAVGGDGINNPGGGSGGGGSGTVTDVMAGCGALTNPGPGITTSGTVSSAFIPHIVTTGDPNLVGGTYTLQSSDCGKGVLLLAAVTAVTVPAATTTGFGSGYYTTINNQSGAALTVTIQTSTIDGMSSVSLNGGSMSFWSDGGTNGGYHFYVGPGLNGGNLFANVGLTIYNGNAFLADGAITFGSGGITTPVIGQNYIGFPAFTVAALPTGGLNGWGAIATDASSTTCSGATLSGGGGGAVGGCLVRYNGSAWVYNYLGTGGAVTSVFTRTGAVVAASGDYTIGQITLPGSDTWTTAGILLAETGSATAPNLDFNVCGVPGASTACGWYAPASGQLALSVAGVVKFDYNITHGLGFNFAAPVYINGQLTTSAFQNGIFETTLQNTSNNSAASNVLGIGNDISVNAFTVTVNSSANTGGNGVKSATLATLATSANSTNPGGLFITAGSASGTTTTGAGITLTLGTGTSANGNLTLVNMPSSGSSISGGSYVCVNSSNQVVLDSVICVSVSSLRFKDLMGSFDGSSSVDLLASAEPIIFKFKDTKRYGEAVHVGLSAESVCAMDEHLCIRDKEHRVESYDRDGMIAYLVAGIQELKHEIDNRGGNYPGILSVPR